MIQLLFCHGRGLLSALIRFQTWSYWSHVAIRVGDDIYEAWPGKGVHKMTVPEFYKHGINGIRSCHVSFDSDYLETRVAGLVREFLEAQTGKKYSYAGVIRFIARFGQRTGVFMPRYFCSELIAAAFQCAGYPLLRDDAAKISPGALITSPLLSS
jgi:uncharacterized protein YycO